MEYINIKSMADIIIWNEPEQYLNLDKIIKLLIEDSTRQIYNGDIL